MKEYKRLTKKADVILLDCEYSCGSLHLDVIKRLGELEDKIENGTLVELPCKVGDILYRVVKGLPISEWKVTSICFNRADMTDYVITATASNPISHWKFWSKDFGETLFLTKAEAEKKLNELKGGVK